jgi:hypothetical protein
MQEEVQKKSLQKVDKNSICEYNGGRDFISLIMDYNEQCKHYKQYSSGRLKK